MPKRKDPSRRNIYVFMSLLGTLCFTCILLLVLSPAPLTPDAAAKLMSIDSPQSQRQMFDQTQPIALGRWRYIYVHHSKTPTGNSILLGSPTAGLGDHFLIGNGNGCDDGEVQMSQRWQSQAGALPPAGASRVSEGCITICLVGDFDLAPPTRTQLEQLTKLIRTLQMRLQIPAKDVTLLENTEGSSGIGRMFPAAYFRAQLAR